MNQPFSDSTPPPSWPKNVRTISLDGLDHLGVDPKTNELYWDGQKIVMERKLSLDWYQTFLATIGAFGALLAGIYPFGAAWGLW
ncbi:hypothetical protein [Mesorhizobium sp.]|uniref:hypothetical protein n=1 Tax=Mesorhizobium sp. TaxID=1871066 RepID=UPI001224744F|nr:hypothetical protein [Mesorhizobium sp.]TIQ99501.1 MAG: hypothetical protein E5X36_08970 [Mesorhizobium sp.]